MDYPIRAEAVPSEENANLYSVMIYIRGSHRTFSQIFPDFTGEYSLQQAEKVAADINREIDLAFKGAITDAVQTLEKAREIRDLVSK